MNVKEQQFYFEYNDVLKDSELRSYVKGFFEHPIKNINLFDLYQIQIPQWGILNGEYIFVGREQNNLFFLFYDSLISFLSLINTGELSIEKHQYIHLYGMSVNKYKKMIKDHFLYLATDVFEYNKNKKLYLKNVFKKCNVVKELNVFSYLT